MALFPWIFFLPHLAQTKCWRNQQPRNTNGYIFKTSSHEKLTLSNERNKKSVVQQGEKLLDNNCSTPPKSTEKKLWSHLTLISKSWTGNQNLHNYWGAMSPPKPSAGMVSGQLGCLPSLGSEWMRMPPHDVCGDHVGSLRWLWPPIQH